MCMSNDFFFLPQCQRHKMWPTDRCIPCENAQTRGSHLSVHEHVQVTLHGNRNVPRLFTGYFKRPRELREMTLLCVNKVWEDVEI